MVGFTPFVRDLSTGYEKETLLDGSKSGYGQTSAPKRPGKMNKCTVFLFIGGQKEFLKTAGTIASNFPSVQPSLFEELNPNVYLLGLGAFEERATVTSTALRALRGPI